MTSQVSNDGFAIGDEVLLVEKSITNEEQTVTGKVVEVREILGKTTYVVETGNGKRRVVGARQILRAE
ncbi:hypothetical protein LARV_00423 [Longilinea arvoryzae]|uniref:Uncharacterized protein n=1 Tax=Longilinea arvoryzae TaxID=360412 RepID=A0A0S7B6B9_9CHLR|nr:hypothetical protein [Longilinea arvoryzae]GAP12687.1 hypothetical protein LARV_00423 [Longilinea arvoryzae]